MKRLSSLCSTWRCCGRSQTFIFGNRSTRLSSPSGRNYQRLAALRVVVFLCKRMKSNFRNSCWKAEDQTEVWKKEKDNFFFCSISDKYAACWDDALATTSLTSLVGREEGKSNGMKKGEDESGEQEGKELLMPHWRHASFFFIQRTLPPLPTMQRKNQMKLFFLLVLFFYPFAFNIDYLLFFFFWDSTWRCPIPTPRPVSSDSVRKELIQSCCNGRSSAIELARRRLFFVADWIDTRDIEKRMGDVESVSSERH